MRPEDFYAKEGEMVRPKLRAFANYVLEQAVAQISGARMVHTRHGRIVTFEPNPVAFAGAFHVSIAGPKSVTVSEGLVNGVMPTINGVYLDGFLPRGQAATDGVPKLDCSEGSGARQLGYVCIRVEIVPGERTFLQFEPDALQMVYVPTLNFRFSEGGAPDEDGVAHWPVAQLRWSDDDQRIERVRQISFFDKTHRYVEIEQQGRHFFDVAA